MKYIIFHFHDFGLGGVQRKIVDLCNYLNDQDQYSPWTPVVVFRWESKFTFIDQINVGKTKVIVAPKALSKFGITYALYLGFVFLWLQPKVVVTFLHSTLRYVGFARLLTFFLDCKVILSQDNIFSLENTSRYSEYVFNPVTLSFWVRFVDSAVTMTYLSKIDLNRSLGFPLRKIKVLPNWLPLGLKRHSQAKVFDVIFAGRLSAQKNVLSIIQIIKKVKLLKPDVSCLIIGNGVYKQALLVKIHRLCLSRNIKVLSATHHVSHLIQKSHCFLLSSKFEGHPLVLLEALHFGAVPVVRKYPGLSEYFVHGVGGYTYISPVEAAAYILTILSDRSHAAGIRVKGQNFNTMYGEKRIEETITFFLASNQ